MPERVEVRIVFWDQNLKHSKDFQIVIPILSYPTEREEEDKKDKKDQAAQPAGSSPAQKPAASVEAKGAKTP